MPVERKNVTSSISVEQLRHIRAAARIEGRNMSEFLRINAESAAETIIKNMRRADPARVKRAYDAIDNVGV